MVIHFAIGMVSCIMSQKPLYMNAKFCLIKIKLHLLRTDLKKKNYIIPNGVTNIGDRAFSECKSLTSIKIPNSVKNIGDSAFYGCRSLTSINIPDSVTNIGDKAFWGCSSLTSINIPNSVTNIGDSAFWCCRSLSNINIPSSVVNINGNPFCNWNGDLYNESKAFVYEHQVLFNKDKTTLIAYISKEKNYIIPNSVTNIGDKAFGGCSSLTSINIPNSVTNIGDSAFRRCDNLPAKIKSDIKKRFGEKVFE